MSDTGLLEKNRVQGRTATTEPAQPSGKYFTGEDEAWLKQKGMTLDGHESAENPGEGEGVDKSDVTLRQRTQDPAGDNVLADTVNVLMDSDINKSKKTFLKGLSEYMYTHLNSLKKMWWRGGSRPERPNQKLTANPPTSPNPPAHQ